MTERQMTHYVGDACPGGHLPDPMRESNVTVEEPSSKDFRAASKPSCIERVHRPDAIGAKYLGRPGTDAPCKNAATWRVDGNGPLGALYSDVPMCSTHRAKYDRAGYRSWRIGDRVGVGTDG